MEKYMDEALRLFFTDQGFMVAAEVNDVDMVCQKDDVLIAVELKQTLNVSLIAQGIKRKKLTDFVYIATLKPTNKVKQSKTFKDKLTIINNACLGLLFVNIKDKSVEVEFDPKSNPVRKNVKQRQKLLKELTERTTRINVAGVTKTKIITAYKELSLRLVYALSEGSKTTKELKAITHNHPKTLSILQKNYDGWFERVSRGEYRLTEDGLSALKSYEQVIKELKMKG